MTITFRLLEAYLKCATKCWLKANGEQPSSGSYAGWAQAQNEPYRAARIHELLSKDMPTRVPKVSLCGWSKRW
jgi:hypothetical protein